MVSRIILVCYCKCCDLIGYSIDYSDSNKTIRLIALTFCEVIRAATSVLRGGGVELVFFGGGGRACFA
jgi:hypothetical protein